MTKKKETGLLASAKEETLNQIITAQKEKIEALTAYGKKLKKELKQCKESMDDNCQQLIDSFMADIEHNDKVHQKMLLMAVIGSLLFGLFLGMII